MTVAAIVLAGAAEGPLDDTAGLARVRRIAEVAWSGGALPIIVAGSDADGGLAGALAGASATVADAGGGASPSDLALVGHGLAATLAEVSDVSAGLLWPARFAWVGPETVTSLIEAHGTDRGSMLVPSFRGESGWPRLVPLAALDALRANAVEATSPAIDGAVALSTALDHAGLPTRLLELGDPGTTSDASVPREDLPPYEGPTVPASGHVHEWGVSTPGEVADDGMPPG